MIRQYELVVLLSASSTTDEVKATTSAITKALEARKGKVVKEDNMGKRALAYPIKKQKDALYIYFDISLDASEAQNFERDIRLMDSIIRSLFIIKDAKV